MIDVDFFKNLHNFERAQERVVEALDALTTDEALVRFMDCYATWNSRFAPGVAQLVANIGDSPDAFLEPGYPRALADRSSLIASYIFDAARDEFNDHITRHRDPHRSLAQAMLSALAKHTAAGYVLDEPTPDWLINISGQVVWAYNGGKSAGNLFKGMGFHIGSELLADAEFSLIDENLRLRHNDLVQKLMRTTADIGGNEHRCYAWVGVHSGHDGGAEADHFAWALEGVNLALKLTDPAKREDALTDLKLGYIRFAEMHNHFFMLVNT